MQLWQTLLTLCEPNKRENKTNEANPSRIILVCKAFFMVKNYFKVAWRNIVKHRFYSFVNMIGLFTGITFALLIGVYVWQELQVNQQLKNGKRQYFLRSTWKDPNLGPDITTLAPLAKRLKEDYPHLVAEYYRWDGITSVVTKGEKHLREGIQLGDSTLLKMYGFTLLHGDANTALNNPFSVVITEELAKKYFGKTDVVGESLNIQSFAGENKPFLITGVLNKPGENSVTNLNTNNNNQLFIPTNTFSYFGRMDFEDWNNIYIPSYVELREGVRPEVLQQPIAQLIRQNAPAVAQKNLNVQPLLLTNYYRNKDNGLVKRMLYTLSLIGLFILLMAVINFVNIAVSRSGARMREIGVRKVLGSMRTQLVFQFLTESLILVFIATLLAVGAYSFVKPIFAQLVGKDIPAFNSFPLYFITIPALVVLMVGLLAGWYPAVVLSSLRAVDSLKRKLKTSKEAISLRKSLVGVQFGIALIVLIAAGLITQQVSYFFGKNLGYNNEYIVSSQVPRNWSPEGIQKMLAVRNEFVNAVPKISSATVSYEIPNGNNGGQPPVYRASADSSAAVAMTALATDENYVKTYQIPIRAGAFFETLVLDSALVILNEKAVQALGFKSNGEAIGQQVRVPGDPIVYTVKGVTSDFKFGSMQSAVPPMIFFNVRFSIAHRYLSFKVKSGNIGETIAAIEKQWVKLLPGSSFEYAFMDDTLKSLYATEMQLKKAAYTATVLAFIIALLGVLGLVSLSIHKRVKEIGVRKVLGASLPSIILLFAREFIVVLVVAALVACPIAYMVMKEWLHNYAYRINITLTPFVLSVMLLGVVTFLLIAFQTVRIVQTNPAKSLKTE
jgi:putative ABC transport system permease protein